MDLFEQFKSEPLWVLLLMAIGSFSILNSFYSILTRLYAKFHRPPTNLTRPIDSASTSASASSTTADSVAAATVYEVFLSFHGEDTRKGFTDFLYTNLVGASIQTFRDNEELRVGEEIGPELLKAIKESKISIPIFSRNYASSKWCLLELEQIVECHKNGGHKIYPIFYDVDPSHVRNQEGSYKLAFNSHKKKFNKVTIQRWRDALEVVGKLKGLELKKETQGHQGELVKRVVDKVLMALNKNYTHVPENLVGMDKHTEELMGLLEVDSDDVQIIGIHGMGGLGKTTISKVIFNEICKNFDGQCFLDNIREKSKDRNGIVELQKQFISSIQKRGETSFSDADHGRSLIKGIVRGNKLLIVLDDVDDYDSQVNMIMGEPSWYGPQSRVILTTRNKDVLDVIDLKCQAEDSCVVRKSYNPNFMNDTDSLQLFSKHAFKRDFPKEEYNILCKEVVSIAAGLPLVLVVLGGTFFPLMNKEDLWKDQLRKLQKIPHKDVLKQLKFSFDALEEPEKEIFLDIACLFIDHDKTRPTYMWESCELYPKLGIHVLVSKSLITIDDEDRFQMHDQLRDLGRQIVREEGLEGKQSRIWCSEEALRVSEETSRVKALRLADDLFNLVAAAPHLPKLRYLSMRYMKNVDGDFKDLLPNLRWLHCNWMLLDNSSLRNLNMKNLVVLDLSCNRGLTDDWDGWRQLKMANNLKVLDLSGNVHIQTFPNLSNSAKLVELYLTGCSGLTEIQGLEKLEFLQVLNIYDCFSLRRLPNISSLKDLKVFKAEHCSELSQIEGLCELVSLEYLQIQYCDSLKEGLGNLSKLNKLQVLTGAPGLDFTDFSNFKHLKKLDICRSNRMEIQKLDGFEALEDLEISYCSSIVRLPNLSYLNRLKTLTIWSCEKLIEIQDLSELKSLEGLTIYFCRLVSELPDLSPLHKLKRLDVSDCEKISDLSRLQKLKYLESLTIRSCRSVKTLPDLSPLQKLKELYVCFCEKISDIPGIEELKSLESLRIITCNSVKALPDLSRLQKLKELYVICCEKISDIPGIEESKSLAYLNIRGSMGLWHLHDLDLPKVKIEADKADLLLEGEMGFPEFLKMKLWVEMQQMRIEKLEKKYAIDENTEDGRDCKREKQD